jgi:hypothetical protein
MNKAAQLKRNANIIKLYRAGVRKSMLADRFELSWVQIDRIIKKEQTNER